MKIDIHKDKNSQNYTFIKIDINLFAEEYAKTIHVKTLRQLIGTRNQSSIVNFC